MLVFYGLVMVQLWCCGPGTAVKTRSPSQQRLQRRVTRLILTVITGAAYDLNMISTQNHVYIIATKHLHTISIFT